MVREIELYLTPFYISGRETRGEAEVGFPALGKTEERHCSRMPRGLCFVCNGEETSHVCPIKPGPKGEDEEDRLPTSGR